MKRIALTGGVGRLGQDAYGAGGPVLRVAFGPFHDEGNGIRQERTERLTSLVVLLLTARRELQHRAFPIDGAGLGLRGIPHTISAQSLEERGHAAEARLTLFALRQVKGDRAGFLHVAGTGQDVRCEHVFVDVAHVVTRVIDSKMMRAALRQW